MLKKVRVVLIGASLLALATPGTATAAQRADYTVTNLVSDQPGVAVHLDPNLVNAWGLAAGPTTPWWVADADANVSTLYRGDGTPLPLVVEVPGGPTGLVFNGSGGFVVGDGTDSGSSVFLFATEQGTIRGWSPAVPPPPLSTQTFVGYDGSDEHANYKGLAIASTADGTVLYAADFHNAEVEMFDDAFQEVTPEGAFEDPKLPAGFAPFGIQTIGDAVFVTYAKQDARAEDEVAGAGLGFVDEFSTNGDLIGRVASKRHLNAPWGVAMAPGNFGAFGGDLLVGNFGDGRINAFAPRPNGKFVFRGQLDSEGAPLSIDGLWSLQFGNDSAAGSSQKLFFTAGPEDESHGLFGSIDPAA
jgi:uncharacterized protein (TIGR03118 family)